MGALGDLLKDRVEASGDDVAIGDPAKERSGALNHLSEDLSGFGSAELRTLCDLLVRPARLLELWMLQGPAVGGLYSRPLRVYLALNGAMMFILLLRGGVDFALFLPPSALQQWSIAAGKGAEAFTADAENWFTLIFVPVTCAFQVLAAAPLIRLWDREDIGWRKGMRATLAFLSAWSLLMLPFTWWSMEPDFIGRVIMVVFLVTALISFLRMGRNRWWRTWSGALVKALLLVVVLQVAALLAIGLVILTSFVVAGHLS